MPLETRREMLSIFFRYVPMASITSHSRLPANVAPLPTGAEGLKGLLRRGLSGSGLDGGRADADAYDAPHAAANNADSSHHDFVIARFFFHGLHLQ